MLYNHSSPEKGCTVVCKSIGIPIFYFFLIQSISKHYFQYIKSVSETTIAFFFFLFFKSHHKGCHTTY